MSTETCPECGTTTINGACPVCVYGERLAATVTTPRDPIPGARVIAGVMPYFGTVLCFIALVDLVLGLTIGEMTTFPLWGVTSAIGFYGFAAVIRLLIAIAEK